jgi:hypothetical protein
LIRKDDPVKGLLGLLVLILASPATAQTMPDYLDDRSTASSLIRSYYNAINRREYARAYGYFDTPDRAYQAFAAGYADTARVDLSLGAPVDEGAAGSVYSTVPVAIRATDAKGGQRVFAGCITTRQVQPAIQEPPFRPIQISAAHLSASDLPFEAAVPAQCPAD